MKATMMRQMVRVGTTADEMAMATEGSAEKPRPLGRGASLTRRLALMIALGLMLPIGGRAGETAVTPEEMACKGEWVKSNLLAKASEMLPFSFMYGGQPSATLLPSWEHKVAKTQLDTNRTQHVLTWTDPKTGLILRCVAVEYRDFPTVEWTLYFKNTGKQDTPILENIQALDIKLDRKQKDEFVLHHQTGDVCGPNSYEPHQIRMASKCNQGFAAVGGWPTWVNFPYFNIEYDGGGVLAVMGWPGQWAARFVRDEAAMLRIAGGQELTHLKLLAGEEIRTPLVVLQFWKGGDWIRSQNIWRRWMIAHNLPRTNGRIPPTFMSGMSDAALAGWPYETAEIAAMDAYQKAGIKYDYWWIDASWFIMPSSKEWIPTGTWEPDPKRFPRGIKAVSDHAHSKGMKLVLWFEPERVAPDTWLYEKHPEWLLSLKVGPLPLGSKLLNLGNPEARQWLTEYMDRFIREQGIDVYRQDFNFSALQFWRDHDAPDRQGMTENLHVQGYLAYWDELRKRNPNLLIDSCAGGGRRNDLETLRRAVPLLRSDYSMGQQGALPKVLIGNQGHTYGLSFWVPFFGTGVRCDDVYSVRSVLTPALGLGNTKSPSDDQIRVNPQLRPRMDDWRAVADELLGDYYPLMPYNLSEKEWIAWQFNRPETGTGMIQAFRRTRSYDSMQRLKLRGLEAAASYEINDRDQEGTTKMSGRELMENGLRVKLDNHPQAALITYKRVNTLTAVISVAEDNCLTRQSVRFDGQNSWSPLGAITAYQWDFSDGTMANGPSVEHAYPAPGSYKVRLTVTDKDGAGDTTVFNLGVTVPDTAPPVISSIRCLKADQIAVTFNEPVEQASAENSSNYVLDRDAKILSASLDAVSATVTLKTSPLAENATYRLTVNNVKDRAAKPNGIAPNSQKELVYNPLLAHWKLDEGKGEKALDASGNGYAGTLKNGAVWATGPKGSALSFDGKAAYVEMGTCFPELAVPFSLALWVNPAAMQVTYADILGNHHGTLGMVMQQDGDKANCFAFGYGGCGTSPVQLAADQWQHVAVVCDGESVVFYVNGVEKGRGKVQGSLEPNAGENFKLGQGYITGRYFHGLLSDVRIYSRAFTAEEIGLLAK